MIEIVLLIAATLALAIFNKCYLQPNLRWKSYLKLREYATPIIANAPQWESFMKYADVYFDDLRNESDIDYGFPVFDHELHMFKQLLDDGYAVHNITGIQKDMYEELAHMDRLVGKYKELMKQDNCLKNGVWNALIDSKRNLEKIIEKGVDEFTEKGAH
ncbi:hypothetical protein ACOMCU_00790 [Lysinibacillus sp. UGB7]|uniref:hypothetical protein n=1 Tax=Lysinibacillus sp. UGB7 TaxID=3411039 RepID=UPI003B76E21A